MKYVSISTPGAARNLQISEGPIPEFQDGEVLIDVKAAGVNGADISQRQGHYPPPKGASPILGLEVAGTVRAVGTHSKWKVGDRVCALVEGGGYADIAKAADGHCLPIPSGFSFEQAAGLPETFFTVWANVFQLGALKPGETFLVHGGSSGIGTTAIQLAHAFGAKVVTTAGSREKCETCLALGADQAINYKEKDFSAVVKNVNLILDMVGGPYTAKNIEVLAPQGRLVNIAARQGNNVTIDIFKIMQKRVTLTGSTLRPRTREEKSAIARDLEAKVWPLLNAGKIKVLVDGIFPLDQVAQAHERMESSQHIGKIILKVQA
jgi:putative PIG3 family NAD(P)H quinone oxidoreductase